MQVRAEDIEKFMRAHGWDLCANDVWFKGGAAIILSEPVIELIDAVYVAGCAFGVGRGAYEEQQQEDAEPSNDSLKEDQCPKCRQFLNSGLLTS